MTEYMPHANTEALLLSLPAWVSDKNGNVLWVRAETQMCGRRFEERNKIVCSPQKELGEEQESQRKHVFQH